MAENYIVNYDINVTAENGIAGIRAFQEATGQLKACMKPFTDLQKVTKTTDIALTKLCNKTFKINVSTKEAEKKLDSLLRKMKSVQTMRSGVIPAKPAKSVSSAPVVVDPAKNYAKNLPKTPKTLLKQIQQVKAQLKTPYTLNINIGKANQNLNKILTKIAQIKTNLATVGGVQITSSTKTTGAGKQAQGVVSQTSPSGSKKIPNPKVTPQPGITNPFYGFFKPGNLGYKVMGDARIAADGMGYVGMLKGMGIAYGIAGLGSLMGNVIKDSSDYDNEMATVRNILQTHDHRANFSGRFNEMAKIIRNVGVETKFTAPEVASAGKFLAMAGFNLEDINKSIRPISDIALVGDTELGETADVVTNIMTGYNIKADYVSRAADIMTMTFTKSNTTLMEMAEAYKYSASILNAAHVPFEEATAALGILGDAGIKGSQAGTTMRTIAANILKPTEKQAEMWNAIGVNRYDKDGTIKSLPEIFQELNQKDLSAGKYYGLFHKTAVSGAVSLAANVDKWNDIIAKNFLSEDLAHKLAEEKKNTIQGLWAQLTSAFTEDGLQSFEELQTPIKNFLKETIDYLKTPEAVETIKGLSRSIMNMMRFLRDFMVSAASWYKIFEPFVNLFFKLQMYIVPLLVSIKALKSIGYVGKYLLGGIGRFGDMATLMAGGLFAKKNAVAPIINNVGESDAKETATTGKFGKTAAFLGISKFGLALQAAALVGAGAYWMYDHWKHVNQLADATKEWRDRIYEVSNGLNISDHATQMDKYLNVIHNKQLSTNEAMGEYIKLLRIKIGLEKGETEESRTPFAESHKDLWEQWKAPLSMFASDDSRALITKPIKDANGNEIEALTIQGHNGKGTPYYYKNSLLGITYDQFYDQSRALNLGSDPASWTLFMRNMYTMGYDTSEGSATKSIADSFVERMYNNITNPDAIKQIVNDIDSYGIERSKDIIPGSEYWNFEYVEKTKKTEAELKNSYPYIKAEIDAMRSIFAPDSPYTKLKDIIIEFSQALAKNGNDIPTDLREKLLLYMGNPFLDASKYGKFGTNDWLQSWGVYGDERRTIPWQYTDNNGNTRTKNIVESEIDAQVNAMYGGLIDSVNKLSKETHSLFSPYINSKAWKPFRKKSSVSSEFAEGDTRTIDGKLYTYRDGQWVDSSGGTYTGGGDLEGAGGQMDYKSQYESRAAAPKQIIVKIENLMNVESIGLSDKNNAAVIESVREQMAQTLIDVVHDFDATYHE